MGRYWVGRGRDGKEGWGVEDDPTTAGGHHTQASGFRKAPAAAGPSSSGFALATGMTVVECGDYI